MTGEASVQTLRSIARHLLVGTIMAAVLIIGVGGWAATTDISGAIIAPGTLVVDSNVKKVQHATGGIVSELLAHDGDRVKAGDVLVRIDATVPRANLAIISKRLDELIALESRLKAELDGRDSVIFPENLLNRLVEKDVARVVDAERKQFETRRSARGGQREQLRQRIAQFREEIGGNEARLGAKGEEIVLIQRELKGARDLWARNLMPISKLTALEREATRIKGEQGQLVAEIAQLKGKISEIELQMSQIDLNFSREVGDELRKIGAEIGEYVERRITREDELKRVQIRAPQDGVVYESTVHTVGGVISAGDVIMLIVPEDDNLTVEARVAPKDIDQLRLGQKAKLRFSAFNQRTTPEVTGLVNRISADTTTDKRTGHSYYTVRIAMNEKELAQLSTVAPVPGMPVEVFLQTGDRKVLSYLFKPLSDQIMRAFRES